jgi:hypothetical protein
MLIQQFTERVMGRNIHQEIERKMFVGKSQLDVVRGSTSEVAACTFDTWWSCAVANRSEWVISATATYCTVAPFLIFHMLRMLGAL